MNIKVFSLVLFCSLGIGLAVMPLYAGAGLTPVKTENYSLYVDKEKINTIYITSDSAHLDIAQLTIKLLPENDFIAYITLPDGGNIVINTGSPSRVTAVQNFISKEITEMGTEYDLMKLFGWKPRIDWLIITANLFTNTGGLSLISKSFEIKEFMTPVQEELPVPPKANNTKIGENKKIDLLQVVSPVELNILGLTRAKMSKNCLILKLSYQKYSFSFLLDLTKEDQEVLLREYPQFIDATVLFSNVPLIQDILQKTTSLFVINKPQGIGFITDGNSLATQAAEVLSSLPTEK